MTQKEKEEKKESEEELEISALPKNWNDIILFCQYCHNNHKFEDIFLLLVKLYWEIVKGIFLFKKNTHRHRHTHKTPTIVFVKQKTCFVCFVMISKDTVNTSFLKD